MNKRLELLGNFVDCQTLSLESQFEALVVALDTPNELVDYVDGLQIIEEHEYSMTVIELWESIQVNDIFGSLGDLLRP